MSVVIHIFDLNIIMRWGSVCRYGHRIIQGISGVRVRNKYLNFISIAGNI